MISYKMGSSSFNQQSSHGIMGEQDLDSTSSSSEVCSFGSLDSDSMEEVASSSASSSSSSSPMGSGPLSDMSSLIQQLPLKRGLSKHYNGKSQSFMCLSNVRYLEDLEKPENPYNKKLKTCKSYGGGLSESHRSNQLPRSTTTSSRLISKKASRGSCSSLGAKRIGSFLNNRSTPIPPPPPHSSTTKIGFSNQTPLFA